MLTTRPGQPADARGIRCEFAVPEEAFMALPLADGAFTCPGGGVRYPPGLREV